MSISPKSLSDLPRQAARAYGDKPFLTMDGETLTFERLDKLSDQTAMGLGEIGVSPGDRVSIFSPNSIEWVAAYFGVLKSGAIVNPLNSMLTDEEVAYAVNDCGAKAIFTAPEKVMAISNTLEHSGDTQVISLSRNDDSAINMSTLSSSDSTLEVTEHDLDSVSSILYTSGTTGQPKGAMLTNRGMLLNTAMTAQMHMRNGDDTYISALPFPHVYGIVVLQSALLVGAYSVCLSKFDPQDFLDAIEKYAPTIMDGVPTMYFYLLDHPGLQTTNMTSLRRCTVGGQSMPPSKMADVEERFGCPLIELWGMTEMSGLGATHPSMAEAAHGSIGVAMPYVELRIADPSDAATTLPDGEVGELMAKGPCIMQGYYNKPEETEKALTSDGWLHTGDLAKRDDLQRYYIVDRKKDMIISSGYNIYPAELERVLSAHPAVAMAAVGKKLDDVKGERAKAYVVLKPDASASSDDIIEHCREHLAPYKVPKLIQFVSDFPRTSSGKILRRLLNTLDE